MPAGPSGMQQGCAAKKSCRHFDLHWPGYANDQSFKLEMARDMTAVAQARTINATAAQRDVHRAAFHAVVGLPSEMHFLPDWVPAGNLKRAGARDNSQLAAHH